MLRVSYDTVAAWKYFACMILHVSLAVHEELIKTMHAEDYVLQHPPEQPFHSKHAP